MKVRIHNNDDTDYADYEADTIKEIREQAKVRITLPTWNEGYSEVLE